MNLNDHLERGRDPPSQPAVGGGEWWYERQRSRGHLYGGRKQALREMNDNYVSRAAVMVMVFWSATGVLIGTTWVLAMLEAPLRYEGATGLTAVLTMALAMVSQMRLYTLRLCNLTRISAGLQSPDAELHPLRR